MRENAKIDFCKARKNQQILIKSLKRKRNVFSAAKHDYDAALVCEECETKINFSVENRKAKTAKNAGMESENRTFLHL